MKKNYKNGVCPQLGKRVEKKMLQSLKSALLLFALLAFGKITNAQTIQVGSGTSIITSEVPVYSCYGYSYTQQIYLASELISAGADGANNQILKIKFKTTYDITLDNSNLWTVYIGHTSKTNYTSTTDWIPASNMTQVFTGSIGTGNAIPGNWVELTLNAPFNWDGTSNLVVAVDENQPGHTCSVWWQGFEPTTLDRAIYYRNDNVNPNPFSPPIANEIVSTIAQIQFEGIFQAPCSGTPYAGINPSTLAVCSGQPFDLSATGVTSGQSGLTGQWQYRTSPGFGVWQDLAGATTATYTVLSALGTPTEYRYSLSCEVGDTGYSNSLTTTINAGNQCYCTPTGGGNNVDEIRNFTLSNLNHSTPASEGVNGYSNYSGTVAPAELETGTPYIASLTSGPGSGSHGAAIWIDLNQNGDFEASEKVADIELTIGASSTVSFPAFTIPVGTPGNTYRLRVQYRYYFSGSDLTPCVQGTYAETEDYAVLLSDPLAITLGNLRAENQGKVNVLDWNTLKETDGDRFEIERSTDGRNFEVIAQLEGKGEPSAYRFIDEKPYTGVNYYRLGFLNIDAAKEYSNIVQATVKGGDFSMKAYPNPTSDVVKIQVMGSIVGKAIITISDVTGKVMKTNIITESEINLPMSKLASGLYIIKYQDDMQNAVLKVTKD